MDIIAQLKKIKQASHELALLHENTRHTVLMELAKKLRHSVAEILKANALDLAQMDSSNPMYDRLLLNETRIGAIADDVEKVANLPSPLLKELDRKLLNNGLTIKKISVPLGVICIIYESRPNVTIDVFSLCFKSGNACVLKGGKEAEHSNRVFVKLIQQVLTEQQLNPDFVYLFSASREELNLLLHARGLIDACIPRGSQDLINFVRDNAKIPVIETGAGIVHSYFDQHGDFEKAQRIIHNAKTRRVSVCNALDCLIIHRNRLADLPALLEPLQNDNVEIFADTESMAALKNHYPQQFLHAAQTSHYGQEFLSYKLAVKTVASVEEAVQHIMNYTSGHSEAIITEDDAAANYFIDHIDAAVVYVNASTAFTDGGQFGMGAEIGISTQKLHARGPMGLEALTSYKWIVTGNGQIRET